MPYLTMKVNIQFQRGIWQFVTAITVSLGQFYSCTLLNQPIVTTFCDVTALQKAASPWHTPPPTILYHREFNEDTLLQ